MGEIIKGRVTGRVMATGRKVIDVKTDTELQAQELFNQKEKSLKMNEHSGDIRWDCIAIVDGKQYIRRTLYSHLIHS